MTSLCIIFPRPTKLLIFSQRHYQLIIFIGFVAYSTLCLSIFLQLTNEKLYIYANVKFLSNGSFGWFLSETYISKFIWILVSLFVMHVLSIGLLAYSWFFIFLRVFFFCVSVLLTWISVVAITNMYNAWLLCLLLIANDLISRSWWMGKHHWWSL
jgi:hypothetical protein